LRLGGIVVVRWSSKIGGKGGLEQFLNTKKTTAYHHSPRSYNTH
jgi:hypothetical protein